MRGEVLIPQEVDVLVVGGGINGAGVARDLAGRALSVLLVEQHDLASHTSSSSTKLIHGGLRYLEHYEFSLVRKALGRARGAAQERAAHHAAAALRDAARPVDAAGVDDPRRPVPVRPPGAARVAARRRTRLDLTRHPAGKPLKPQFRRGFEYSDGWVDDARLVVLCAMHARQRGAQVLTRCRCERARWVDGRWRVELTRADGARAQRDGARAGQRHRTVGGVVPAASSSSWPERQVAAPGQGQPHRGAQDVRARTRLHLPERRPAHHLRHPVRRRLHADRHHRRRVPRRPGHTRAPTRRRSPTCASRPAAISRAPVTPDRRALELLGRAAAARRRLRATRRR